MPDKVERLLREAREEMGKWPSFMHAPAGGDRGLWEAGGRGVQVFSVQTWFAECLTCGWKGPYRDTEYDARPDRDRHRCPTEGGK